MLQLRLQLFPVRETNLLNFFENNLRWMLCDQMLWDHISYKYFVAPFCSWQLSYDCWLLHWCHNNLQLSHQLLICIVINSCMYVHTRVTFYNCAFSLVFTWSCFTYLLADHVCTPLPLKDH